MSPIFRLLCVNHREVACFTRYPVSQLIHIFKCLVRLSRYAGSPVSKTAHFILLSRRTVLTKYHHDLLAESSHDSFERAYRPVALTTLQTR